MTHSYQLENLTRKLERNSDAKNHIYSKLAKLRLQEFVNKLIYMMRWNSRSIEFDMIVEYSFLIR